MKNLKTLLVLFCILILSNRNYAQSMLVDGKKILFVGNGKVGSEGGLHNHFRRALKHMKDPISIKTDWISMYGKKTLKDMLTEDLKERIKNGDDDIIIVQSGAISELEVFAKLIQENGKEMVVYGIWPDNPFVENNTFEAFTDTISENYKELLIFQKESNIPVAPCGLAYQYLMAEKPIHETLRNDFLFTPESSMPNDFSSMVNVAMLYTTMTGKSPIGLPMWNPFPKYLIKDIQTRTFAVYESWRKGKLLLQSLKNSNENPPENEMDFNQEPLWTPILKGGSKIYYVGNSYIGTEGGLDNHFPRLLKETNSPFQPQTKSQIFWGQGLQKMLTEEVKKHIKKGPEDVVVVTSGPRVYLDSFNAKINAVRKKMVVHMTWGRNPSLKGMEYYKKTTEAIVKESREFEEETGIPVIPCGLIYYDLIIDPPVFKDMILRQDWVFMEQNIHQNHIGTMVNAAAHYAVMTGQSPIGLPMWNPILKNWCMPYKKELGTLFKNGKKEK